jgi:hypothetical protein
VRYLEDLMTPREVLKHFPLSEIFGTLPDYTFQKPTVMNDKTELSLLYSYMLTITSLSCKITLSLVLS